MKILHVVGGLDRGGAETWLVQVLRGLDRERYHFDFLVHGAGPYDYEAEVRSLGAKVVFCPWPINPVRYWRVFAAALRENGPYDCVHAHTHHFSALPLTIALMAHVPHRLIHSHLDTIELVAQYRWVRRCYAFTMRRLIAAVATDGICVSTRAGDSLFPTTWRRTQRWRCAPLGIDLEPFRRRVDTRQCRDRLGIPSDAFVVGHVGRFVEQKNHTFILDVAAAVLAELPAARFLLVGTGPLLHDIQTKARELGIADHVHFVGVRSDVAELMLGAMDAFFFPSRYEGLGLVVMEAQAAGLPSLISDTVPAEVDCDVGLVSRLPLSTSAREWATQLLSFRQRRIVPAPIERIRCIDDSISNLLHTYDNLPFPTNQ